MSETELGVDVEIEERLRKLLAAAELEHKAAIERVRTLAQRIDRLRLAVGGPTASAERQQALGTRTYLPNRHHLIADFLRERGAMTVARIAAALDWDSRLTRACVNNHTEMFHITREPGAPIVVSLKEKTK